MVPRRHILPAIRAAQEWIASVDLPADDHDAILRRAFSGAAVQLLDSEGPGKGKFLTQAQLDAVQAHEGRDPSDLVLLLAVCAAARRFGLEYAPLRKMAEPSGEALARWPPPIAADLALASALFCACGISRPGVQGGQASLPCLPELIEADRPSVLNLCRTVANVTAWGQTAVVVRPEFVHLPALAASWAREWDVELTCALLRTCSYLGLRTDPVFAWCLEWLLDQQQDDGRFGLLAPEAKRLSRDPNDWNLYFKLTIDAIWTLAELCRPGLFLGGNPG